MKRIACTLICLALFAFWFLFVSPVVKAQSEPGHWSCSAVAFVPIDDAIQKDLFDSGLGRLFFKEGKRGNAVFFCPLTHAVNMQITQLKLTYRDGDGKEVSKDRVDATLKRVRLSDGAIENILQVSSNDGPNSGPEGWATAVKGFCPPDVPCGGHLVNLDAYFYYVQINMVREDPGVAIGVLGVQLFLTKK